MSHKRPKTTRKAPKPAPGNRPVQEILLELAYRLHATVPVATLRRGPGSVA